MKLAIILLTAFIVINGVALSQTQLADKYLIVNFEATNSNSEILASNVTYEFEESLINTNCFKVLERKKLNFLQIKRNDELQIFLSEGNKNPDFQKLKTKNVEYLALGTIHEDEEGGNYRISVRIVNFASEIIAYKSVYTPKSIKLDPNLRNNFLFELASKLCPTSSQFPIEEEASNIKFILQEVRFSGSNLNLDLTLVNQEQSKSFELRGSTVAYDDHGRERFISTATLVDKNFNFGGKGADYKTIEKRLVYDTPSKITISFSDFPKDAKQISELIINFRVIGVNHGVYSLVFQNIDIK